VDKSGETTHDAHLTESDSRQANQPAPDGKDDAGDRRSGLFWGILMVVVGALILGSQLFDLGGFWNAFSLYLLPVLGLIFIGWGIVSREAGYFIPGGILSGLGVGVLLTGGPFAVTAGDTGGGAFMLSFALGFVSITVLTAIFTKEIQWWALIPGAIMGLVGLTVIYGGIFEQTLVLLGQLWPIALIVGGIYLIYKVSRREKQGT
jgi:hypothetical protein